MVLNCKFYFLLSALAYIAVLMTPLQAEAQAEKSLSLVGNKVASLIDSGDNPSRASELVKAAMLPQKINFTATSQAWSGSGLGNGQFDGYIDQYSLNRQKPNFIYSQPYALVYLHVASMDDKAKDVKRLESIYRQRVGIENRFANSDEVRGERDVRWARSPNFLSNMEQLAGRRVDYIIADKIMLDEFNKLLLAENEQPLVISSNSIYKVELSLGLNRKIPNAKLILERFDKAIERMKEDQSYNQIYLPTVTADSILDASLYSDILKKW